MNHEALRESVRKYCSAIGEDPMLVQGAGGNVSWKDNDRLWVKASGTWLVDAEKKNIFVSVNLPHVRTAISSRDFKISPKLNEKSSLRPSIETLLHALMPHTVVVHLHAVEVLAHLVKESAEYLIDESINWVEVEYYKPGEALATAVSRALQRKKNVNVILLKNHGIVIGGSDIDEVDKILRSITQSLASTPCVPVNIPPRNLSLFEGRESQLFPIEDAGVQQLAIDRTLFNRLRTDWAICPDHIVFLGAKAEIYDSMDEFRERESSVTQGVVFIKGKGVFAKQEFSLAKLAQLRCYYDILSRLPLGCKVSTLTHQQVAELLNWDAEQYRINLAK